MREEVRLECGTHAVCANAHPQADRGAPERRQEGRAERRRDRQNSDKASTAGNITATNRAALSLKDQQRQAE